LSGTFSLKIALSFGDYQPTYHIVRQAKPTHSAKQHVDRFSHFCMGPKCYAVQCFVNGEENPQNCPFPLGFCNCARGGQATAIVNIRRKTGKDCTSGSGDIVADRQTHIDRQADRHTAMLITILRYHSRGQSN